MSLAPPPILFPDVEMLLTGDGQSGRPLGLLRSALAARGEPYAQDVYLGNTVPSKRRPRMVIVRRDGGRSSGVLDDARVSLRVWADDEADAALLSLLVLGLCRGLPTAGASALKRFTHESGPTPIPDESKQHLRYLVGTFRTRGAPL